MNIIFAVAFWFFLVGMICYFFRGVFKNETPEDEESRAELRMMIEMGSHSGDIQGHKFPWWKDKKHV